MLTPPLSAIAALVLALATGGTPPGEIPFTKDMPALAARVLASYHGSDRTTDLDNRFRLQIVAGRYADAERSLNLLRRDEDPAYPQSATNYSQYVIFVRAMRMQSIAVPFAQAFARAFTRFVGPLSDVKAAYVIRRFIILAGLQNGVDADLKAQGAKPAISLGDALDLLRRYQIATMYRAFATQTSALIARDDRRRYVIERNVLVKAPDGRSMCAYVVRPRGAKRALPALLEYSIYADRRIVLQDPRLSAAHGYAGVNAYTPGTACSSGAIVPYVGEGAHADAVIRWISRRPWSDGRVGMFGGSYNGFAVWAAAKDAPSALKALMSSVSNAPGVDTPMERNVFETWVFPWPLYTTAAKWLDASTETMPFDLAQVQKRWYVSGKAYSSLDRIAGVRNPIWDGWLHHPRYDAFWQSLIPYRSDFARIHLPALLTDGYLSGQNVGGIYYFSQYRRHSPSAQAYFVVGPYDHFAGQFGTTTSAGRDEREIDGYAIDPAADVDMQALRYAWFDFIFKGAAKPALLADRVNYEVMHGNHWEHAPTIGAMARRILSVHLRNARQSVNFADRADVNRVPPATGLDTYLGIAYESAPLAHAVEVNGIISGRLDFICNKRDFDFNIGLFQRLPDGTYEAVTNYMARASYVGDPSLRKLLTPGRRTSLRFTGSRLTAWKFERGSRIVVLVSIVKDPGLELNYGTGKAVADETIADAKMPLRIQWFPDSVVDVPVR